MLSLLGFLALLACSTHAASVSNVTFLENQPRIPIICFGNVPIATAESEAAVNADPEDFIHFHLYTKANPIEGDVLLIDSVESVEKSSFIRGAPIKFISHGFMSGIKTNYPWDLRESYLKWDKDLNVILVDWKELANNPTYVISAERTKIVGQKSGRLLAFLVREGYVSHENLHIMGMSLGGHVAGVTGSTLNELTGRKAARVSGCDPAMPWFITAPDSDKLDASDGEFVDVVHAAGLSLGIFNPAGHVDFYPNNGKPVQPGCGLTDLLGCCSHFRAALFCLESINLEGPRFNACKCDSWSAYDKGTCACTETAVMGEHCSTSAAHGSYYLRTNKVKPYAQG